MQRITVLIAALGALCSTALVAQETAGGAIEAVESRMEASPAVQSAIDEVVAAAETLVTQDAYPKDPRVRNWRDARVNPIDYPPSSWVAGEEGEVSFDVSVDAQGNVLECTITRSSGYDALDTKSCDIVLERALFSPALDENGTAIAGIYLGSHNWKMREPEFPGTATIHVSFDVSETGELSNCQTIEATGTLSLATREQLERQPCPLRMPTRNNIYRDENGVPVAKTIGLKFEIVVSDPE